LSREFGLVGIALAEVVAAVACMAVSYPVLFKQLQLGLGEFLGSIWRPVVASATMGLSVHWVIASLGADGSFSGAVGQLLIGLPAGVALYVSVLYLLWTASGRPPSAERTVMLRARDALRATLRARRA
jgi:peptidoglycan biosynthesis protein MviN/MurJ (putative lipid II flippase)